MHVFVDFLHVRLVLRGSDSLITYEFSHISTTSRTTVTSMSLSGSLSITFKQCSFYKCWEIKIIRRISVIFSGNPKATKCYL